MAEAKTFADTDIAEWAAAFAPTVREFPAARFVVIQDGDLVRFAFGHNGPPLDEAGNRGTPVFSVAISMSPGLVVQLRDLLNRIVQVKAVGGSEDGPQ